MVDTVVVRKFPNPQDPMLDRRRLVSAGNLGKLLYRFYYSAKVGNTLRRRAVRLLHVNTLIGTSAALGGALSRVPIVWHVQEHDIHFQRAGGVRVRVVRMLATHVIAISNHVRALLLASGVPSERVTVVHNGIDAHAFRAQVDSQRVRALKEEFNIPSGHQVVGMAGQLTPIKGVDVFVQMAARIRAQPGNNTHFLVLGTTPRPEDASYAAAVRESVRSADLERCFTFAGHRQDIASCIALMDVFVTPSRGEPFGLVNLEAMALQKPVVATSVGGSAEVIDDGVTGFLAAPSRPEELAAKALRLLHDARLRSAFGAAGFARVRQEFGLERYIDEVTAVYEHVLHQPKGSALVRRENE
jgi:glycosyltransferase involved in cell wall biosynthesis